VLWTVCANVVIVTAGKRYAITLKLRKQFPESNGVKDPNDSLMPELLAVHAVCCWLCDALCQPITLAASKRKASNKGGKGLGKESPKRGRSETPLYEEEPQDEAQDDAHVFEVPAIPPPRVSKRGHEDGDPSLVEQIVDADNRKNQVCCVCCVCCDRCVVCCVLCAVCYMFDFGSDHG
jgi:hypothetical protein